MIFKSYGSIVLLTTLALFSSIPEAKAVSECGKASEGQHSPTVNADPSSELSKYQQAFNSLETELFSVSSRLTHADVHQHLLETDEIRSASSSMSALLDLQGPLDDETFRLTAESTLNMTKRALEARGFAGALGFPKNMTVRDLSELRDALFKLPLRIRELEDLRNELVSGWLILLDRYYERLSQENESVSVFRENLRRGIEFLHPRVAGLDVTIVGLQREVEHMRYEHRLGFYKSQLVMMSPQPMTGALARFMGRRELLQISRQKEMFSRHRHALRTLLLRYRKLNEMVEQKFR